MGENPHQNNCVARQQAIRQKRSLMGLGAYACTAVLVVFSYLAGLLPASVVAVFLIAAAAINTLFLILIRTGANLRFKHPDMTLQQVLLSIVPGYVVIFFVEDGLARAGFLLLALVPLAFGILGLDTRRSLFAGAVVFTAYLTLLGALAMLRPESVSPVGDLVLTVAFLAAVFQISLLGGYIHGIRSKLREKNQALNDALATIEDLINYDELTGTYNRRYLLEIIEQEAQRSSRGAGTFSVGIFDVDHFKQVNDNHGHLVGDRVLAEAAAAIQASVRQIDCFGRYGGEEFLLIMPQTDLRGAVIKAERLRRAVAALRVEGDCEPIIVTISGGLAAYHPGEPFTATLNRADEALYQAKTDGRDRVVAAGPDTKRRVGDLRT